VEGKDNIQAAIDAGRRIGTIEGGFQTAKIADFRPMMLKPSGVELLDLERYLERPLRSRAVVKLDDAESFVHYVNRFKDGGTIVFADLDGRKFQAVLDYHETNGARWGKHRATFACDTTSDWKTWEESDETAMSQVDFARFIENNIPNIAKPPAAELVEICLTLEAKKNVQFRSSARLRNGQTQLRYEETIEGSAGSANGTVDIPERIVLGIEPFRGVGIKRIDARFNYRIERGALSMFYELERPQDVLQAAFDELVAKIRDGLSGVPVLAGAAPDIQ
jgi:uncharacterized protein YfdQ (DUF2303 family)